jgi:hypothetical protein
MVLQIGGNRASREVASPGLDTCLSLHAATHDEDPVVLEGHGQNGPQTVMDHMITHTGEGIGNRDAGG